MPDLVNHIHLYPKIYSETIQNASYCVSFDDIYKSREAHILCHKVYILVVYMNSEKAKTHFLYVV